MTGLPEHLDASERARMFDAFERAATHAGLALFLVHVDASPPRVIFASELLSEILGRPRSELIGVPAWELVAPDEHQRAREIMATRGPGAPPITLQFTVERADRTRRHVEVGVARITTPNAELAVCYFRDNTDELRAVRESHKAEAKFARLVENAPDGVVIVQEGRIALANPAAMKLLGAKSIEALRGLLLSELLSPEDATRAAQRIALATTGDPQPPSEYRNRAGDLVVEVHAVPYELDDKPAILAFVRNVTERKRLQKELVRADRLAALGTMAATVAHEINNPLTYLRLSLERLRSELDGDSGNERNAALRELVDNAMHGADRVGRIVRDLRARTRASRGEGAQPCDALAAADEDKRVLDLASVVDAALKMVDHDLRHRARLVKSFAEGLFVRAEGARLEQVLVNVLVNASQSLDGADGANHAVTITVFARGNDACVSVRDTGRGIADGTRIFEPFFTTKPDVGMGLGLSVSREIVTSLGGTIEVASSVGVGTTVTISLPRVHDSKMPVPPSLEATQAANSVSARRLRVLVVDDDELVRRVTRMALARHYDLEEAAGGGAALELIASRPFDVILCDLMMPDVTGRELYEAVRARFPGVERRFVFVTAGGFVPSLASFLASVDNLRLSKPFAIEQALAVVHAAHQRQFT